MRLWSQVSSGQCVYPSPFKDDAKMFADLAKDAQKVRVDNVYRYAYDNYCGSVVQLAKIPCGLPPFDAMWLEWNYSLDPASTQQGVLVETVTEDLLKETIRKGHLLENTAHASLVSNFLGLDGLGAIMVGYDAVGQDEEGTVISRNSEVLEHDLPSFKTEDSQRVRRTALLSGTIVHLFACSFMNCDNVRLVDEQFPRQQRRRAERKGERLPEGYRVVVIDAMERVLRRKIHHTGAPNLDVGVAMHVCRGHFNRYGEKYGRGKLFGKYEGKFFIPQMVRGDPKRGKVEKEYVVGPVGEKGGG